MGTNEMINELTCNEKLDLGSQSDSNTKISMKNLEKLIL